VLRQQRHQLVALARLTTAPLGVLLEPGILAHLRWATRTTIAEWRTRTTRATRTTIAERRARATRATIGERRARTTRPTAERRARATRAAHTRNRRHSALKGRALAATIGPTEPLTAARRATTATVTAAALTATATTTAATTGAATTATWPNRHVAATAVVVVHPATVHALASATALAVAIRAHLHHNRRSIINRGGCGGCYAQLLEVRKLLQKRFLKTLSHPFSYCARAVPASRARS